eukprot:1381750-Amorphochlora_amoeboformis.AAC.1
MHTRATSDRREGKRSRDTKRGNKKRGETREPKKGERREWKKVWASGFGKPSFYPRGERGEKDIQA